MMRNFIFIACLLTLLWRALYGQILYHISDALTGGKFKQVEVSGGYLLMIDEYSLNTLDITNPGLPVIVNEYPLNKLPNSFVVQDSLAYLLVTMPNQLLILNVVDPFDIQEIGSVDLEEEYWDICVDRHYVFLRMSGSFSIYDIIDPSNPVFVSTTTGSGICCSTDIYNNHLYCGGLYPMPCLKIYNVEDVYNPYFVSSLSSWNFSGLSIKVVSEDEVFLGDSMQGIRLITGCPNHPQESQACFIEGLVIDVHDFSDGCMICGAGSGFDIAYCNFGQFSIGGSVPYCGSSYDVLYHEDHCYLSQYYRGLRVINVNNSSSPYVSGEINGYGDIFSFAVDDTLAYVWGEYGGLFILNITEPYEPEIIGSYGIGQSWQYDRPVDASNGLVSYGATSGIHIVDATNPANPYLIGELEGFWSITELVMVDTMVYINRGEGEEGITGVSISDPQNPVAIASFNNGTDDVNCLDVEGNLAYLGTDYGLKIVDISNPSNYSEVAQLSIGSNIYALDKEGNYIYCSNWFGESTFSIINVSDPASPYLVTSQVIDFSFMSISVCYNLAVLGISDSELAGGVYLIDISDPINPTFIACDSLPTYTSDVYVNEEYIYAASSSRFSIYGHNAVSLEEQANLSIPESASLESIRPNPFNTSTIIRYELREEGFVKLVIYDVCGREITRLCNGFQSVGNYQQVFNGQGLSSGVYFARLTAGNFTQTQKIVMLK